MRADATSASSSVGTPGARSEGARTREADPTTAIARQLEALLMVADEPQSLIDLATAVGAPVAAVRQAMTALVAGVDEKGVVVARFLALLELYRHSSISFEQVEPLGELSVRWVAETWTEENLAALGADYAG